MSRTTRFKIGFFLAIALVLLFSIIFASNKVFRSADAIPDDKLAVIGRGDLALSVVATGSIAPLATVEVKSKASGLIKEILVEEGDQVKAGQVLVELDKELLAAQVREAEANRMAVAARLEEAEAAAESAASMKKKLELDLKNAADNLAFVERQVERFRSMYRENLVSRSDMDKAERDLQDARLKVEALKSELMMQQATIEGARKAVARARAELVQAEANLDRARENLRFATITSPITGTVLKRHVEVGDAVSSILQLGSEATLLLTLGDMSELFVEGRVDESDIGRVFVGQQARVKVDAFRERTFAGRVIRISPLGEKIDNVIGFEVIVRIQDPEKILRPQMSANAEIIIEEKKRVLAIPESAVIYDKQRAAFAELYDPSAKGLRRRVPIKIGISNGTLTELVAGLKEGDRVILQ